MSDVCHAPSCCLPSDIADEANALDMGQQLMDKHFIQNVSGGADNTKFEGSAKTFYRCVLVVACSSPKSWRWIVRCALSPCSINADILHAHTK